VVVQVSLGPGAVECRQQAGRSAEPYEVVTGDTSDGVAS